MPPATLLVQAIVQFVTAASFAYVGGTIRAHQPTTHDGHVATTAFVAWWWSMAVYMALVGILDVAGFAGLTDYPFFLGAQVVMVPLLASAAWGIMTYVLFLFTGKRAVAIWTGAYSTILALAFWFQTFHDAHGAITIGDWTAGVTRPTDARLLNVVYVMFALPLIASTLSYMSLLARVREPAKRYRIAMVSGGLLAWVAGGFAGASSGSALAQFVSITLLGALVAAMVVLAYRPPRRVQAWLDRRAGASQVETARERGPRLAPAVG